MFTSKHRNVSSSNVVSSIEKQQESTSSRCGWYVVVDVEDVVGWCRLPVDKSVRRFNVERVKSNANIMSMKL
jgi:hypothetical protein